MCSALELQSRAIVPGSIRIVYAVIYSLFLGFGIAIGAAIYGLIDENAVSTTSCENPIPTLYTFVFVPLFVVCIAILYQAKWRQMPVMLVVAFAGEQPPSVDCFFPSSVSLPFPPSGDLVSQRRIARRVRYRRLDEFGIASYDGVSSTARGRPG